MLSAMDDNIGRALKALKEAGLEEQTLVCFISDNGGPIVRNAPNASQNTPLRGGKGETWEGGIRVPFFMKWPGHLKAGTTFDQVVIQMDLTATVLELAGVQRDAKWPLDGVGLLPYLNGEKKNPHETLCWEYGRQWAIRQGDWKLTFALPTKEAKEPILGLFDLSRDISESRDLAAAQPEKVKQLRTAWEQWRKAVIGDQPAPEVKIKKVNKAP
jgi:arylsulfatase A-like enzyme